MSLSRPSQLFPFQVGQPLVSSYLHFDMALTEEQKSALKKLTVKNDCYENNGDLENIFDELNKFIINLSSSNIEISQVVANLVCDLVKKVLATMERESAIIMVRTSEPNDFFKKPRWHTDGYYFESTNREQEDEQYKVVASLIGPNTLFYSLPDEQRDDYNKLDEDREKTAAFMQNNIPDVISNDTATIFIAGSKRRAAVHSEPDINTPRFFLSITPDSRERIKEKQKRDEEFRNSPEYKEILEAMKMKISKK